MSFSGNFYLAGTFTVFPLSFSFDGSSAVCASLASDIGYGTISGDLAGYDITYSRLGSYLLLSGWVDIDALWEPFYLSAPCAFTPTSWNPVNTYALTCAWVETT